MWVRLVSDEHDFITDVRPPPQPSKGDRLLPVPTQNIFGGRRGLKVPHPQGLDSFCLLSRAAMLTVERIRRRFKLLR